MLKDVGVSYKEENIELPLFFKQAKAVSAISKIISDLQEFTAQLLKPQNRREEPKPKTNTKIKRRGNCESKILKPVLV